MEIDINSLIVYNCINMNKEAISFRKNAGRTYWERMRVGNGVILEDKIARLNKKVILEIGPSETPFPIYGEKGVKKDECYIGMDINPNKVEETVNLLNLVGFPKDKVQMIVGGVRKNFKRQDGSIGELKLPLCDGSVGEVIMSNVIGDPRVLEVGEIMDEATRVLDPKGDIVVVQTRAYLYPIRELELLMGKRGFELRNKNVYDIKEINKYRPSEGNEGEYIAKFSRKGVNPDPNVDTTI